MNAKKVIYTAVLTCFMLATCAMTAWAADDWARIETVDGTDISGWAYNIDDPSDVYTITVTIEDKKTGDILATRKTTAELYREDLEAEGKGDGCCGFEVAVDWDDYDTDGPFIIKASADGKEFPNSISYHEGEITDASIISVDNPKYLGVFKTTAYCPCQSCSEGWGATTCTGVTATANHTIAVDPSVIPLGSQVMIDGIIYTAEDRGGGVKGNHIDIFFDHHEDTYNYGKRSVDVYLVS